MKKLLALVLALVMTLSLAVVGSNAAFKDADKVSATYAEAVDVLAGMKVFQGYPDNSFQPEGSITRAEVAAIVYRLYTADVADKQASLYATYNKFADMDGAAWAKGYIGYCGNAGLIKGYDAKTFGPSNKVTGYEVLAMILRAVGYDKNDEFTGAQWQLRVASTAQQLGILKNVKGVDLNAAATRELVAELLFQTAAKVAMVTYTPALGYTNLTAILNGKTNATLGEKNFGLAKVENTSDEWGRPGHVWYDSRTTTDGKYNELKSTVYATIADKADATYTVATTECDIAAALGLKANKEFTLYTNGSVNGSKYVVQPLDTVQKLGAQGTLLEVYNDAKVIVAIDTFLAKVTDVKEATYDPQGHLKTPASITLGIYTTDTNNTATATSAFQTNGSTNYTYAKGDMVLVNAYTTNNVNNTTGAVAVNGIAVTSGKANYMDILGVAKTMEGAQTFLWYNNLKHTVEGTNYDDAKWFKLDQAGTQTEKHVWYFDSYGNLIGATDLATQYAYGVIENIQWQNPALSSGYAQATIRYMDGTTETKVVTSINGKTLSYAGTYTNGVSSQYRQPSLADGYVSTTTQENAAQFFGTDLYRVETAADGTVKLNHVAHTDASTVYASHLESATIKGNSSLTALAAITGTPVSGDAHNIIYTNSNTTFLIRNATSVANVYTYTVVKGYENVPNYSNATVDYVNVDGDSYADYVYITGTPDNATYFGMFYLTNTVAKEYLKTAGGTDYYEIEGYVDGAKTTIKLDAAATIDSGSGDVAVSTMTKAQLENVLVKFMNRMVTVYHVNDRVTAMYGPKSDIAGPTAGANDALFTETHSNVAYTNLALDYQAVKKDANGNVVAGTVTKTGNVLKVDNVYYNILAENLASTTNGYAWAATEDLSSKEVYVVYDKVNTISGVATYVAKAVYVADPASSGNNSGVTPAPTGTWAASGIAGYEVNTTLSKVYVANANIKALGAVVSDWTAAGYVVTTTVGGVTSVVPTTATETVYSAILGGAKLTLSNASSSYTLVYEK